MICQEQQPISIHALLAESDARRASRQHPAGISIHALLAESDPTAGMLRFDPLISIHALLAESDSPPSVTPTASRNFYPRSPCGERPFTTTITICTVSFLSTLSLRRATYMGVTVLGIQHNFYPRSPCGERRIGLVFLWWGVRFLSTLSLRRATSISSIINNVVNDFYPRSPCGERPLLALLICPPLDFYPRSPCGERRRQGCRLGARVCISIHALLAESDSILFSILFKIFEFLSTLSLRRATSDKVPLAESTAISIHALLAESDPCGAARGAAAGVFLSTLSLRRATQAKGFEISAHSISIHALLAESDNTNLRRHRGNDNFYPRSPCGERLRHCTTYLNCSRFLSTLSLRRATPLR